jgi:hypothetical protein
MKDIIFEDKKPEVKRKTPLLPPITRFPINCLEWHPRRKKEILPLIDCTQYMKLTPQDIIEPNDEIWSGQYEKWFKSNCIGRYAGQGIYRRRLH